MIAVIAVVAVIAVIAVIAYRLLVVAERGIHEERAVLLCPARLRGEVGSMRMDAYEKTLIENELQGAKESSADMREQIERKQVATIRGAHRSGKPPLVGTSTR